MKTTLQTIACAALLFAGLPLASSSAQVDLAVTIAPPEIPIYEQPLCPAEGYLWTPGYWAYADFGYYWVPGVWVEPPRPRLLWTPGYWGYNDGGYAFNDGYWGPSVGFYGGINYGFGYGGSGYYGGEWVGESFRYNTAVTRVDASVIRNTYINKQVVNNFNGSRAGFNGPGGVQAQASAQELAAAKAEHIAATQAQRARMEAAKSDPGLHAANNHGKPPADAIKALEAKGGAAPVARAGKTKGGAAQTAAGNSAFGQKHGDATTRTKGSQNNAFGKAQSANARSKNSSAKANRGDGAAARPARVSQKQNRHSNASTSAPGGARHANVMPSKGRASAPRAGAPAPRGPAPGRGNQKKKPNEPGH